ncbi:MAG TPA: pitrilysin family protein [Thermoanaerobaculia bacterium]|nr:pitrilysin family protein [Thermoanaerobaculia bacterium]
MRTTATLTTLTLALVALALVAPPLLAHDPEPQPAAGEVERVTVPVENAAATPGPGIELVTLASPESPVIALRAFFRVGSIDDPAGKEGLAALTASMIGESGTAKRSYKELVEALYPMAASIQVQVDREVTVFHAEVHRETLADFTSLFTEVLLQPGFDARDFERHREQLRSYLVNTLRASNDELLGLEVLQQQIFAGHPYDHSPAGTVQGLAAITLDDVKQFYRQHLTRANLLLGVAGGYPEGYPERLATSLSGLTPGAPGSRELPAPKRPAGRHFTLIDKQAAAVGIQFGYPLPLTRADADYYPLLVANSVLGEHRTFHGRLMQQLRGKRGLNYGDYSYIEHYYLPPFTSNPTPNVPRRDQYFSVWVRPVQPEATHFALRAALYEVDRLVAQGLTEEEFVLTRDFVVNYSKLWAQTLADRLGFLLDSRYYGTPYYIDEIEARLAALTRDEVNRAVKKYLQTADFTAVLVTGDAAALEARLESEEPSPMTYASPVEAAVAAADEAIVELPVKPASVAIVPVAEVFEK